ncbi:MAG: RnfABCDGE type electron transport complex subunit D [Clostridia bacterium]|nr:RnfABCDGE type electron transport complex subunit D [Clostridia bacterium]
MDRLTVSSSPHIRHEDSSKGIMLDVIISLLPLTVAACIMYGWYSLLLTAVTVVAAVVSEYVCCKVMKRKNSIYDLSAVVTGLILALNLPPHLPLWMAVIGSVIAIVVVKMMFGGIGHNFANPAITARIALLVSFPSAMTAWVVPKGAEVITGATDATSMATPLTTDGYSYTDLFMGRIPGSLGETFKFLIVLAFLYLVIRRVISPVIPLVTVGTVALMSVIFGLDPLYMILSGGLLFGAVFMATDYVTSPINWKGHIIYGVGIGALTFLIRRFGYLPEGVSYAILLMNLFVPYINRITAPKPFGWEAKK